MIVLETRAERDFARLRKLQDQNFSVTEENSVAFSDAAFEYGAVQLASGAYTVRDILPEDEGS